MNKLTTALRTGDLRPKDRVLLLLHNEVAKDKTGKETLTETDKHALGEGWHPSDNGQAQTYNRYLEGVNLMHNAEIDAQTTYLSATVALLRARSVIDMSVSKDAESALQFCKQVTKERTNFESGESPLDLVLQNSGLEFDQVVHRYAFGSLSEELQKDVLALYPDARSENQYLDQEEAVTEAFDGKGKLTKEAKEKLAGLIVESLHNKYANMFRKLNTKNADLREEYFFSGYYADLPALEILSKWAFYNHQMPKEAEDLLRHLPENKEYANESEEVGDLFDAIRKELTPRLYDYADKHGKSVGELLRETLVQWLDDGLFTKDFTPIWNSKGKSTCNDIDTKLPHKEVFKEWLRAKRKAEETIRGLVDTGALKVVNRVETIKRFRSNFRNKVESDDEDAFKRTVTLITGESLYALPGDFSFAADYKHQADDFAGLGGLVLFLRERSFMQQYGVLLEFVELFKRLSTVYEIDLTYKITNWLCDFRSDMELMNGEILLIADKLQEASHKKHNIAFLIEIFVEDMLIDMEKVKLTKGRAGKYFKEIGQALGSEFGSHKAEEDETEG